MSRDDSGASCAPARKTGRGWLTAAVALLALALPATAAAHPGVYEVEALLRPDGQTCEYPDDSCLAPQTQYAVGNDGWAEAFAEANGLESGPGMINYKKLPGAWRAPMTPLEKLQYVPAQTGLQPHATCSGVAGLDDPSTVLAWQGSDPFYAYVPWQKAPAGLGDDPAEWIPVVQEATGVNLATLGSRAEFESACTGLGGAYHEADKASSITAAQVAAAVAGAVAPFESEVAGLLGQRTSLRQQIAAREAAWGSERTGLTAARDSLAVANRALRKRVRGLKSARARQAKRIRTLVKRLKRERDR